MLPESLRCPLHHQQTAVLKHDGNWLIASLGFVAIT